MQITDFNYAAIKDEIESPETDLNNVESREPALCYESLIESMVNPFDKIHHASEALYIDINSVAELNSKCDPIEGRIVLDQSNIVVNELESSNQSSIETYEHVAYTSSLNRIETLRSKYARNIHEIYIIIGETDKQEFESFNGPTFNEYLIELIQNATIITVEEYLFSLPDLFLTLKVFMKPKSPVISSKREHELPELLVKYFQALSGPVARPYNKGNEIPQDHPDFSTYHRSTTQNSKSI